MRDSMVSGELSSEEKILLVRDAGAAAEPPRLDLLVSLARDLDAEVRHAAQEALRRLPEEPCARLLAEPSLEEAVARYFLEPAHLRPALLAVLLANPATPQEAIADLAAQAGAETMPLLLEHLGLLKTPALVALKSNPAYLVQQKAAPAERPRFTPEERVLVARGAIEVPEEQRLEVLVSLVADPDAAVSRAAQETLRQLPDERCAGLMLATAVVEESVARYFLQAANTRPAFLAILLTNSASPQDAITALAAQAGPEIIPSLLDNLDLLKTASLVALKDNPAYLKWQKEPPTQGLVLEVDLLEMLIQEAEAESLQPVPPAIDEVPEDVQGDAAQVGIYSKIAKMNVAARVKLALLGTRDERALLVRDSSKVVTRAVLGSPKLSDSEVESFASMKNVSQDVLRLISMNRKFMKSYTVLKNLAFNPRTPIDVGLTLINRLIANDLRALGGSKDIPDTTRKMAQKLAKARQGS